MVFPEITAFIEIPYGSIHKYEYDFLLKKMIVARTIAPLCYPYSYGFIPNTVCSDGDPLDIIVLGSDIFASGQTIPVVIIGVLELSDDKGYDPKIIAVPEHSVTKKIDIALCHDIEQFITQIKAQKKERVLFHGWHDEIRAHEIIKKFTNS